MNLKPYKKEDFTQKIFIIDRKTARRRFNLLRKQAKVPSQHYKGRWKMFWGAVKAMRYKQEVKQEVKHVG